jgi:small-conductance mechanosensitive channel
MRTVLRVGALGVVTAAAALFVAGLNAAFLAACAVIWLLTSAVLVFADHIGQSRVRRAAARGTVPQTQIGSVRLIAVALPVIPLTVAGVCALVTGRVLLNVALGVAIAAFAEAARLSAWHLNRAKMERQGYHW